MNDDLILMALPLGNMQTNCYVLGNTKTNEAYVFDPGAEPDQVFHMLEKENLTLCGIILTHGHFDHILAVDDILKRVDRQIPIYACEEEKIVFKKEEINLCGMVGESFSFKPTHYLKDGEILEICGTKVKCLHTPGHTCGGMCYYIEDKYWLIAGDTLFEGSIGRTDFPTGSYEELSKAIKEKIYTLPDWTKVFPGHGQQTTVGEEKVSNMFVHL